MTCDYYITGKNGFIGKALVKYLTDRGNNIIDEIQPGCIVIHLAAYGNHYFQTDVKKIEKANITDLIELVEKSREVKKLYNISTSSITLPKQTMYSASKLFGETFINSLNDDRFINVRPYSVYGPGEADHRFIPTVIRCLQDGRVMKLDPHATHDWIYVDDFIEAMLEGYTSIGTGGSYRNIEVVQMLEYISGVQLNYTEATLRDYDIKNWVCFDGVPSRSLFDGLKQTYESFTQKNP